MFCKFWKYLANTYTSLQECKAWVYWYVRLVVSNGFKL